MIDKSRDSLFITFERTALVKIDAEDKIQNGIVLRLHNNSSCSVVITSGSAEKFLKPLPPNPTPLQRLRREIEYTLPNGVLVPEVQYKYSSKRGMIKGVGGDNFFGFLLSGSNNLMFEVPARNLDFSFGGKIEISFRYVWENESRAIYRPVEHLVTFYVGDLSSETSRELTRKLRLSMDTDYPSVWFAPVDDPNKPAWEILPQEAKPGEVILSKRKELGILSNFAATPFELNGESYASVEGFWQMMLYPEGGTDERGRDKRVTWKYTRDQVAQMTAFEAKQAGTLAEENMKTLGIDWVTYNGKKFPYRSQTPGEHYKLIVAAMRAKLEQNPEVKRILVATGDLVLKPDHHGEENPPPEWKYYEILMKLRDENEAKQK